MLKVGATVARYAIEDVLGEGGMARVYRVRHTTLGTLFALKVLNIAAPGLRERLIAEGRAQSLLQHPHVVRVVDVIDVDDHGGIGLVMDLVDGDDLHTWIEREHPDVPTALDVFRGVLEAMRAAHHQGLVHRDLKPANILMARGPTGAWVPRVSDFGLVKAVRGPEATLGATRAGMPMGTPSYMPPEQIRDASSVDVRADVFALGCLLYELVVHERAFVGDDPIDIFDKVRAGRHQPIPDHVPAPVARTIRRCLVPDRDRRLDSVEAIERSLDQVVPLPAVVVPPWAPLAALGLLAMGGLGGAAALSGIVYVLRSEPAPTTATDVPPGAVPCDNPVSGWVPLAGGAWPKEGADWVARQPVVIREARDAAATCLLLPGTQARVDRLEEPMDPADPMVHLDGKTMALSPKDADVLLEPPICWGEVSGWVVSRSIFTRPSNDSSWEVRPTQALRTDRPTEANGWETEHEALCTVPAGAHVELDGEVEKVRGSGVWMPVRRVY